MNFNSWTFVLFFLVVYAMVAPMRRYSTLHKWVLLLASWYFYASWNWQYLGLILFLITFVVLSFSRLLLARLKKGEGSRS